MTGTFARTISLAMLGCIPAAGAEIASSQTRSPPNFPEIAIIGFPTPLDLPNTAETLQGEVRPQSSREKRLVLQGDVLFDFDKSNLRPDADVYLREFFGRNRKQLTGRTIVIEGHTDSKGSHTYNQRLSRERARTISVWIVHHADLRQKRTVELGFGESRPRAPNTFPDGSDNPDGRQLNRRVEIVVSG